MPAVDDLLAEMAAHPPEAPTPVAEIRGRARRRARRRRALVSAAAVVAVAVAGVGVALAADEPGDEVVAEGGTTASSSSASTGSTSSSPSATSDGGPTTSEGPVATEPPTMTLDPATGHEDGTVVAMALDVPATGPALVAQCAAEAEALGDGSPDVLPWCTTPVEMRAEALRPFTLARTIPTPDGIVDCAEAAGRCTLGVRVGGAASPDDRYAPLVFRDDLPPPVEPTVEVDGDDGTVADGDTMLVTVRGVATGDVVNVAQCTGATPLEEDDDGWDCDSVRSRQLTVAAGPETQLTVTAFHDVFVNTAPPGGWQPSWTACEPCQVQIRVSSRPDPIARLPLVMEPTATPIRPSLTLDPSGPWAPGEDVVVGLTGFQPFTSAHVAWCAVVPPQGGGSSPCAGPGEEGSETVLVDEGGGATLAAYTLPVSVLPDGQSCTEGPGRCGVGLHAVDWFAYLAVVPLDLTG